MTRLADRVSVLGATEACADAARAALEHAGIDESSVTVQSGLGSAGRGPVVFVVESAGELPTDALIASPDRDFVLLADVPEQLALRVELLGKRRARRAARRDSADRLRIGVVKIIWAMHRAETLDEIAQILTEGARELFGAHDAALVVPTGELGDDEPLPTVCWTARRGCSRDIAPLAEPLIPRRPGESQRPEAAPPLADHERIATRSLEHHPELLAELAPGEASAIANVVPVDCDVNVTGGLFIIDVAGAPRRTSYDEELLAYLGLQAGRAVSETWLRERERVGRERLRETSAELQRLVDEMDELGVIVRSIADAINVGVLFYDVNNQPRLHNRRVEELLALTGFDPKTGRSKHVYASDRRTRVKQDKNIISETIEGDQRGLIYWIGDPAHEQRAIVTEAHRISRVGGERLGSVVVTYDVTDLANAIEIREEYLATVSHELRTPLTSIVGYLDLIDDARDVEALGFGKEFRTIQRSAEQMLTLIRDLLSTSTHDLALRIEPTDVSALLSQSVSAFRPTLDSSHQLLRLETPPGTVLAHVDPGRIKQVVDNLISNAVKYTSDGGTITVRLGRDAESLTIAVADTGRGISKTDQARLFDRFFRSRDVRDAAIQGVGIGLTIVRTIVLAHGGTIDVESEPGQGSTFLVRLPLRAEATPLPTLSMQP